jgi:hypothetical protein
MKSQNLPKILLIGFGFALVIYIVAFGFIQHRRTHQGPWQVVFMSDHAAKPGLLVKNPKLNISQHIAFSDQTVPETNFTRSFVFDDPTQTNVPFGEVIFQDLTFLPGTVTFNFFGHEVELLPRTLIIDKQEHAWKTGEVISITGPGKFQPRESK